MLDRAMKDDPLRDMLLNQGVRVAEIQRELTAIPALGPDNGGAGEWKKALAIEKILCAFGITPEWHVCPDKRADNGGRPNLVAQIPGRFNRRLWLFGHMDIVPPGDPNSWRGDPWTLRQEGDFVIGRGVEDNQQAICSMLILAECLHALKIVPDLGLGLVFMADEESGSSFGLKWLLEESPQLFSPGDIYIVPDGGSKDAKDIEIAEKAQLWLKFTVRGAQCHASMPQMGKNAFLGASRLALALDKLNDVFPQKNNLFKPATSTFVLSRHEENVPSVNILPGKDIFYMDCRLLPEVHKEDVLGHVCEICGHVAAAANLEVEFDIVHWQPASRVAEDAPVISVLEEAILSVYGVRAAPVGIGGATVAAMLREKGLQAVVWSCIENTCHQPEERSSIKATCMDAAVFAHILQSGGDNA